jgi:hypothetical protein
MELLNGKTLELMNYFEDDANLRIPELFIQRKIIFKRFKIKLFRF